MKRMLELNLIFIHRHHRYIFEERQKHEEKHTAARLQELGPRFTLKLLSLQRDTFDSKGEFEFMHRSKMNANRRRFVL